MKSILLFIYLLVSISISAQNGVIWSSATNISTNGNSSPVVQVLGDGTPVMIWGNNGSIYFTKKIEDNFIEPIAISTENISPDIYSFGGIDMTSNGNNIFIVFEDFTTGVHLIRSNDGGETFLPPINAYDPIAGKWATLPSIAVDGNGNPFISVILEKTNETEGQYIIITSDDGGETFNQPVIANEAADGEYVCECCPSGLVTNGDTIWVAFRNNDDNKRDMWVARSTDNGSSFTEAVDIDKTDWVINACPISGPNIGSMEGDSLISIWMSAANGPSRVYYTTLNGNTMEKGSEEILALTGNGIQINPDIAGENGYIGMVWEESGFEENGSDIMFAYSQNGSAELSNNIINLTDTIGSQQLPSIAYHNHTFHLLYKEGNTLKYQSGIIETLNALPPQINNELQISVLQNPIRNNQIEFVFEGETPTDFLSAQLLNLNGQLIQEWKSLSLNSNNTLNLKTEPLTTNIYLLKLTSDEGNWFGKILW